MLREHVYSIKHPHSVQMILLAQTTKRARKEKTGFHLGEGIKYPTLLDGRVFQEPKDGYYTLRFKSKDLITVSFAEQLKQFLGTNSIIKLT